MEIPFSDELTSRLVDVLSTLSEGSRIPSERALSETLGVSRTALRDRLMRLEAIGVLERRAGSGTYLRTMSSSIAGDTLTMGLMVSHLTPGAMVPVRVGLEREAARQAAMRSDHMNWARMAVALDEMVVGVPDSELRDADYRFHAALMRASGEPGLIFLADVMRDIVWATVRAIPLLERQAQMHGVHKAIHDAVVGQDPEAAMKAVDVHFEWLEAMAAQGAFEAKTDSDATTPA